jgi:hypothetical protein
MENKFLCKKRVLEDQTGFDTTIKIGGINENAAEDNVSQSKSYI